MHLTPHDARTGRLDERGIALPMAMLGLIVITLLVTAAMLSSSTEAASSQAQVDGVSSLYLANQAVDQYVSDAAQNLLPTGQLVQGTNPFAPRLAADGGTARGPAYNVTVTRLFRGTPTLINDDREVTIAETYSLVADPVSGRGRAVGALVDVARTGPSGRLVVDAGVSVASDRVTVNGSITLSGRQDETKCATGANVNAVDLASNVNATIDPRNVEGGQTEIQRVTLNKEQFARQILGGTRPDSLARVANIKFGFDGQAAFPTNGEPNANINARSSKLNWGCPRLLVDCNADTDLRLDPVQDTDYYPVVAIQVPPGSTANPGRGHGQGVLIVMGNLHLNSQFVYNGIVVVTGDLTVNGNAQIQGALVAIGDVLVQNSSADTGAEESQLNGNALVRYNSCEVTNAIAAMQRQAANNAPQVFRAPTYNWFELVR